MKFIKFIKEALSSDSPTSSKRLCGLTGWIVSLICVIYAVISNTDSPEIVNTLFIASTSLLGLDSITNIFRKK